MRKALIVIILSCVCLALRAQDRKTENLVIITLDGFRWQEMFQGADQKILRNKDYTHNQHVAQTFNADTPEERRRKLMPFFWSTIATQGQLYGNRQYQNRVDCSNPHWFSYPGYSEMLVGFVDKRIKSNDQIENPNPTVLEYIRDHNAAFGNRVAVFATWDAIPYVVREKSANIPANGGKEVATAEPNSRVALLNELQEVAVNHHGSRHDAFTFYQAFEYMQQERPRLMFLSFDETDEHGHGGRYDSYLTSAHYTDRMIGILWNWIQSQPDYKDKTTLLITTDHGRGQGKHNWKKHGRLAFGSGEIWMAVIGPDTPALGEMKTDNQYWQKQVAQTAAAFLGMTYENKEPVGDAITDMFQATPPVSFSNASGGN